jgi:GNAT superfamily N-acetyltransferase
VTTYEVRKARAADLPALERMWRDFERESPAPHWVDVDPEQELGEIRAAVEGGTVFLAEAEDEPIGFAVAQARAARAVRLSDLYVRPDARVRGVAKALVRAVVDELAVDGRNTLYLEVQASNSVARTVYQHWGMREEELVLAVGTGPLRERLAKEHHAVSFASIHVQTDDRAWVERTVAQFGPRVGSKASRLEGPRNGWTAVYDSVADSDPNVLLRFAREISERLGAVVIALALEMGQVVRLIALDRGGIVDEYLSVPEFYGTLPPGDVIGLAANPTVLHRLTGADPAAVKAVARTASTPDGLPPARELLAAIAGVLGLEGALHGFEAGE